jgi:hypothetical protein
VLGNSAVEMHPAFLWTCDSCGRHNFVRSVAFEPESARLTDEQRQAVEEMPGGWFSYPETVQCPHCGSEFDAVDPD